MDRTALKTSLNISHKRIVSFYLLLSLHFIIILIEDIIIRYIDKRCSKILCPLGTMWSTSWKTLVFFFVSIKNREKNNIKNIGKKIVKRNFETEDHNGPQLGMLKWAQVYLDYS